MQNVGTPVFYLDELSWRKANGINMVVSQTSSSWHVVSGKMDNLFGLNPSNGVEIAIDGQHGNDTIYFMSNDLNFPDNRTYHATILGHNFASFSGWYKWDAYQGNPEDYNYTTNEIVINSEPDFDGFTIVKYNTQDTDRWRIQVNPVGASDYQNTEGAEYTSGVNLKIGSIVIGGVYEMPHSPDLNLKLTYEYDGVKTIQTKNGVTLSNAMYTKPADWGSQGAWQLGGNQNYRTGRRTWDLSFSYLADTDVFPANASTSYAATIGSETGYGTNTYINTQGTEGDVSDDTFEFTSNIVDAHNEETGKSDFLSQVWNKTLGNALPFIFQPDNTNNSPDQFCIAKFVGDTLQYKQVAHNVYNIKLKIEEVW